MERKIKEGAKRVRGRQSPYGYLKQSVHQHNFNTATGVECLSILACVLFCQGTNKCMAQLYLLLQLMSQDILFFQYCCPLD